MHVACLPALTEVVLAPKRPAHWGQSIGLTPDPLSKLQSPQVATAFV